MADADRFRTDDLRFFNFLLNRRITASGKEKLPWMLYEFGILNAEGRRKAISRLIVRPFLFANHFVFVRCPLPYSSDSER